MWANNRLSANGSVFYIDWEDLQLNVPDPFVPGQFYISNVGDATSKGVEFELAARAAEGFDLFTSVGYTNARFRRRQHLERPECWRQQDPERSGLHGQLRRPVLWAR